MGWEFLLTNKAAWPNYVREESEPERLERETLSRRQTNERIQPQLGNRFVNDHWRAESH